MLPDAQADVEAHVARTPSSMLRMASGPSWFCQDVLPEELSVGDHIYQWGSPMHAHHGLVYEILEAPELVADEDDESDRLLDRISVLHLCFEGEESKGPKVNCVPLRTFLTLGWKGWDGSLKLSRYNVSWAEHKVKLPGTCYPFAADTPAAVLQRGKALLETSHLRPQDLQDLTFADCEHIIVWCKTGKWKYSQTDNALGIARVVALVACVVAACRKPGSRFLPFIGGVLLWKVTQQDVTGDCTGGLPPFLLKEGNDDSTQLPLARQVSKDATEAADDVENEYVVVEDMRASSGYIVCANQAPPAKTSA